MEENIEADERWIYIGNIRIRGIWGKRICADGKTLKETLFRGRQIKVSPKRTNRPGLSTTNRRPRGRGHGGGRVIVKYIYVGAHRRPRFYPSSKKRSSIGYIFWNVLCICQSLLRTIHLYSSSVMSFMVMPLGNGISARMLYREIEEAVAFMASYFYYKLPRRQVDVFSERLANALTRLCVPFVRYGGIIEAYLEEKSSAGTPCSSYEEYSCTKLVLVYAIVVKNGSKKHVTADVRHLAKWSSK